jgi:hypothetical protein
MAGFPQFGPSRRPNVPLPLIRLRQRDSTRADLVGAAGATEKSRMTRLELVGADTRVGRWAAAESDRDGSTGGTGELVPIGSARGHRRGSRPSARLSPVRSGPISSPANGCSASCYALRSIGPSGGGERVAVRHIHVDDDGPDGEAA